MRRTNKSFGRERKLEIVADLKRHVLAFERIHFSGCHALQRITRVGDVFLQTGIIEGRNRRRWLKQSALYSFDGAERVMRNRLDLKAQRKHVGGQARLDDLIQSIGSSKIRLWSTEDRKRVASPRDTAWEVEANAARSIRAGTSLVHAPVAGINAGRAGGRKPRGTLPAMKTRPWLSSSLALGEPQRRQLLETTTQPGLFSATR